MSVILCTYYEEFSCEMNNQFHLDFLVLIPVTIVTPILVPLSNEILIPSKKIPMCWLQKYDF